MVKVSQIPQTTCYLNERQLGQDVSLHSYCLNKVKTQFTVVVINTRLIWLLVLRPSGQGGTLVITSQDLLGDDDCKTPNIDGEDDGDDDCLQDTKH